MRAASAALAFQFPPLLRSKPLTYHFAETRGYAPHQPMIAELLLDRPLRRLAKDRGCHRRGVEIPPPRQKRT